MNAARRLTAYRAVLAKRRRVTERLRQQIGATRDLLTQQADLAGQLDEDARAARAAVEQCEQRIDDLLGAERCPVDRLLALQRHMGSLTERQAVLRTRALEAAETAHATQRKLDEMGAQLRRNCVSVQAQQGLIDALRRDLARAAEAALDEHADELAQARHVAARPARGGD